MPNLVCIGVGGTGAACVETSLHLAASGLFPANWTIVPICIDPDGAHPRVSGATAFARQYVEARPTTTNLADGFLGPRVSRAANVSVRPAEANSLWALFGLTAGAPATAVASLFFDGATMGNGPSDQFRNGFYGHCSAGSCFFVCPEAAERVIAAVGETLNEPASRVVVFGSFFGGTGAAGLLAVASILGSEHPTVPRAIVALEPYFHLDAPPGDGRPLINDPASYGRRMQSAYGFQYELTPHPASSLFLIGTQRTVAYSSALFRRDQQNNPPHWLEYLAAAAARTWVSEPTPEAFDVRYVPATEREMGHETDPATSPSRLLWRAALAHRLIVDLLEPVVGDADSGEREWVPGHPWVSDVVDKMKAAPQEDLGGRLDRPETLARQRLAEHLRRTRDLLSAILDRACISRTGGAWADAARTEAWTRSFPASFLPELGALDLSRILHASKLDPLRIFESFEPSRDGQLPLRALFRWLDRDEVIKEIPRWESDPLAKEQRLLVRNAAPRRRGGQAVNIPGTGPSFHSANRPVLDDLAGAALEAPFGERAALDAKELASLWANALVYQQSLAQRSDAAPNEDDFLHLGLLWAATLQVANQAAPPVRWYPLAGLGSQALACALERTFPFGSFSNLYSTTATGLLALASPWGGQLVGFFFPTTLIVPAAQLDSPTRARLQELGRYGGRAFSNSISERFQTWPDRMREVGIANPNQPWQTLLPAFLRRFDGQPDAGHAGDWASLPVDSPPDPSPWLAEALDV